MVCPLLPAVKNIGLTTSFLGILVSGVVILSASVAPRPPRLQKGYLPLFLYPMSPSETFRGE